MHPRAVQTRKRRIYDVTNVLEGVGLIQKTGTNNVQWVSPDESSALSTRRFREVHEKRLQELRLLKQQMDGSVAHLTECIHQLTSRPEAQQMLYVTQRDIVSLEGLRGCGPAVVANDFNSCGASAALYTPLYRVKAKRVRSATQASMCDLALGRTCASWRILVRAFGRPQSACARLCAGSS